MNPNESVNRFTKSKQSHSEILKEVIFEISCKIDEVIIQIRQLETNRQRASSQESADQVNHLSAIRSGSPGAASTHIGLAPPQLTNHNKTADKNPFYRGTNLLYSQSQENCNLSNFASTADITLILDEREKRLQTKEELVRCKEELLNLNN